ncbi:PepSY domain-containing protein [Thalassotalea litorea]|uniref:PepSY domain-containing protein n=1 Tax=Thalassotalea litorea TaxID=2020715 RepID=UPI0037366A49
MLTEKRLRKLHRLLLTLIFVQVVLWGVSGLYMVVMDIDFIRGTPFKSAPQPLVAEKVIVPPAVLLNRFDSIKSIRLRMLADTPVYVVDDGVNVSMVNAETSESISINETRTIEIARKGYLTLNDTPAINAINLFTDVAPEEIPTSILPAWQVEFDDGVNTRFYIDATTGEILRVRHQYWRLFDLMWQLHIMDYDDGADIDNPLLSAFIISTLLALGSGMALLVVHFHRQADKRARQGRTQAKSLFSSSKRQLRYWHRRLALLTLIPLCLWLVSAAYLNMFAPHFQHDYSKQTETYHSMSSNQADVIMDAVNLALSRVVQADQLAKLPIQSPDDRQFDPHLKQLLQHEYRESPITEIDFIPFPAQLVTPLLLLRNANDKAWLVDPVTLNINTLNKQQALALLLAKYEFEADNMTITMQSDGVDDMPEFSGKLWQIDVDDHVETTFYIDSINGSLFGPFNRYTRLESLFLRIHFFDYAGSLGFNHWWNILFALLYLILSLSGIAYLFRFVKNKLPLKIHSVKARRNRQVA